MHDIPANYKIGAILLFLFVVVSTPLSNWHSFIFYFFLIFSLTILSKISILILLKRSTIEIPFILFAFLMPFFGTGETFQLGIFTLYETGLVAGLTLILKGTIGVMMAILLSTTTTAREILLGLEKLKLPKLLVQIATFMLRYVNVVSDEMYRMKIARTSRGFDAKGFKDWKVLGHSAGSLFIRSYERGERVHLAMLSRGYVGTLPKVHQIQPERKYLAISMLVPLLALLFTLLDRYINS